MTLNATHNEAVTVVLALGGTATQGADYTNTTTTVTIPAGDLTGTLNVTVADDDIDEEQGYEEPVIPKRSTGGVCFHVPDGTPTNEIVSKSEPG